jgi:hypothetical protein
MTPSACDSYHHTFGRSEPSYWRMPRPGYYENV